MPQFVVLYTKPAENAEAFLEEYSTDHLAIAATFPKMTSHSTTVLTATPRRTEPAFYVMFKGNWDTDADFQEAMGHPSIMQASGHAMGMLKKYGNSAEMMVGNDL